jgi:MoxR-like ATPase
MLYGVNARAKNLLAEAMTFPPKERAEMATELLASLDGEPEEGVEEAWAEEIERREQEALSGVPASSDAYEFLDGLKARLRASR